MTQFNDPIRLPKDSGKSDIEAESSIGRKEKPNRRPDSKKDFKEVYEKDKKGEEVSEGKVKGEKDAAAKQPSASIFELSAHKESMPLASAMGRKVGKELSEAVGKGSEVGKGEVQPREGLAPQRQDLVTTRPDATVETTPARAEEMKNLVEQIAKAITTIKTKGETETLITLKHPPMFEGAQLKLTAYESAKGEFNISFTNLTQEAKNMLDAHQNALHQTLDSRGFTVHIIVTSTVDEGPRPMEGEPTAREDRGGKGGQEQQQEREGQG